MVRRLPNIQALGLSMNTTKKVPQSQVPYQHDNLKEISGERDFSLWQGIPNAAEVHVGHITDSSHCLPPDSP